MGTWAAHFRRIQVRPPEKATDQVELRSKVGQNPTLWTEGVPSQTEFDTVKQRLAKSD